MAPSPSSNRLPLSHPDYRYPESRNPYWQKVREQQGQAFGDNATEEHRGSWRNQFADHSQYPDPTRPLHVELGCNAGHVVLEWAARDPATAFIGVDWKFKVIHRAAEKAKGRKLRNLLFFRAHSERLPFMFAPGEIDRLSLFFPDPWPKKSQWKNRYLTAERLRELAPLLRPGTGRFHIKTDHAGYFEWMEEAVSQCSTTWRVVERTTDLHAHHPDPTQLKIPDVTLFERLFIKDGIPIKSLTLAPL